MEGDVLVYGSYGYTGALITRSALDRGLEPILGGRRAERVERQATEFDLAHRVFSLEHPEVVEREVADVDVVLNCAGPFTSTAEPLVEACLQAGTDYLDIAGSIDVLEWVAEQDAQATAENVALVPGVGFDVVPTDCLAAMLHGALPSGDRLTLALDGLDTFSPGTMKSVVGNLQRPGAVRIDERVREVPLAWKRRTFEFPSGERTAVTVPWGDVSTAYYTTGVGNIEVYATVHPRVADALARARPLAGVLGTRPVQAGLKWLVDRTVSGPTAAERARSATHVWGRVEDSEGRRVTARLRTPDAYDVTAWSAVAAAERTLDGEPGDGFQTPASAFGPEFVLDMSGVTREFVDELATVEQ